MNYQSLSYKIEDQIGYIILNRPKRLNAFDMTLGNELYQVLRSFANDSSLRCVVITGSEAAFCGGGDVKEMYAAKEKGTFLRDLTRQIHRCVIEIRTMEKPVIAAINGIAYGAGLSLALACDILIASEDAKMNTAFIGIGLAPGCGTQLFSEIVGYHRACEYILTAKTFTAKEALQLGLINTVVPQEELTASVEKYADLFRTLPPIAVGKAKMLINHSRSNDFITHLELESQTAAISATTKDFTEGVTAFVEKRKPQFIGQ